MHLLSIQSHVAYGHVGNAAAIFPLQRLGIDVWPIHTVQFSNHPGYGAWTGQLFDADTIRDLVIGIETHGAFARCDGVLSGYIGSATVGEAVLDAVVRVKRANPQARYCCDPVIGDTGRGVYVQGGVPEFIASQALAAADVVTPNQFELEYISGQTIDTLSHALAAVDRVHARGPRHVLVTSVDTAETPERSVDVLGSGPEGCFRVRTPLLPTSVHGAGDVIAALFFAHLLQSASTAAALSRATSSVFGVLKATAVRGARELLVVEAQQEFVQPGEVFEPERVRA